MMRRQSRRNGRKHSPGVPVVASAAVLVLSACSSGDSSHVRDSLTFALQNAPVSMAVAKESGNGQIVFGLVNDSLERLGPNGSLTPSLAESAKMPNATTLVYHLRRNVRFSDGKPLTAQDVAWSLEQDFAHTSIWGGTLPALKNVSATGPDEVTVHFTRYDPTARARISQAGLVYEAAQAQAHQKDFGTESAIPVGTGPYRITRFTNDGIVLERNGNYWGSPPPIKQIKFVYIAQDNTAQLAMRSGAIQGAVVGKPQTTPQWKALPGVRLYALQPGYTYFVSLDVTSPPFNDVHVRKAIAHAVDRKGLADAIFHGAATPAKSIVTAEEISAIAPSADEAQRVLDGLPEYAFDLAQAKAELAQSAYPHGFTTTLPYYSDFGYTQVIAQSLQHTLGSIGVKVQLKPLTTAQWNADVYATHKNLGMQIQGQAGSTGDPNDVLGVLVGKGNAVAYGTNWANYYPPSVEHARTVIFGSTDKPARWQATTELVTQIGTDVPYIPLFTGSDQIALAGGFRFNTATMFLPYFHNSGQWSFMLR
jgi:peptide/nickel transport system substrate-binding protein